jgi:predicted nucleic acid-binding protein
LIVADTNLLAYLLLPGQHTGAAERVFQADHEWAAPVLWRSELRSVLGQQLRRGELDVAGALVLFSHAERILDRREYLVGSGAVLDLLTNTGCSAYDCEFVALANALDVPLVTSDRRVLTAFPGRAVRMEEFT